MVLDNFGFNGGKNSLEIEGYKYDSVFAVSLFLEIFF